MAVVRTRFYVGSDLIKFLFNLEKKIVHGSKPNQNMKKSGRKRFVVAFQMNGCLRESLQLTGPLAFTSLGSKYLQDANSYMHFMRNSNMLGFITT